MKFDHRLRKESKISISELINTTPKNLVVKQIIELVLTKVETNGQELIKKQLPYLLEYSAHIV